MELETAYKPKVGRQQATHSKAKLSPFVCRDYRYFIKFAVFLFLI